MKKNSKPLSLAEQTERWKAAHRNSNVMSAKQYSLALYLEHLGTRIIDIETLDTLHQGTIRSLLIRGYLIQNSPSTLKWTTDGSKAFRAFANARYHRGVASHHFCSLLSLEVYDARSARYEAGSEVSSPLAAMRA